MDINIMGCLKILNFTEWRIDISDGSIYKEILTRVNDRARCAYLYSRHKYIGSFKNGMYSGQGIETLYFDEQTQVKDRFFSENTFQYGTKQLLSKMVNW